MPALFEPAPENDQELTPEEEAISLVSDILQEMVDIEFFDQTVDRSINTTELCQAISQYPESIFVLDENDRNQKKERVSPDGHTLLDWAYYRGDARLISILISAGATRSGSPPQDEQRDPSMGCR